MPAPTRRPGLRGARLAALLLGVCLLPALLALPFLHEPFERDEGVYATIAQGVLAGDLPYVDYYEIKPPLIYGWYAASFLLLGDGVEAPRVLAAVNLCLTALLVFAAGHLLFTPRLALYAAALYALSTGCAFLQFNANTEVFLLAPMTASLVAFLVALNKKSPWWMLAAGLAGGLAIMTKQVAVWNLVALYAALIWLGSRGSWQRDCLQPGLALFAGAVIAVVAVLLPFLLRGGLGHFFEIAVRDGWLYVQNVSLLSRLAGLGRLSLEVLATAPFLFLAAMGIRWGWPPRTAGTVALCLWSAGSALGVASGGRFFPHYFVQLLPALALLAAPALDRVLAELRSDMAANRRRALTAAALLAPCLFLNLGVYLRTTPQERHLAKFPDAQAMAAIQARDVAGYVRLNTQPNEPILNWGREAQIYFYARRKPANKYLADWSFWDVKPTFDRAMVQLIARPPVLILDSLPPPGSRESWAKYHPPAFVHFLQREYDYVGRVHFVHVYRLKERPPASPDYDVIEDEYAFALHRQGHLGGPRD